MIKTPRLIIAPLTKSDCAGIHYKNSFSEVAAFNTIGIPKNLKVTEDFYSLFLSLNKLKMVSNLDGVFACLKKILLLGN
jgi:hypothetical protein